jgi:hypothetical protein
MLEVQLLQQVLLLLQCIPLCLHGAAQHTNTTRLQLAAGDSSYTASSCNLLSQHMRCGAITPGC